MSAAYDVIIIGAGIVGAACAAECAAAGLRCAVVDRDMATTGATGAGMGHIVVMDDSEAQFLLTRYSQVLWAELRPHLPAEAEYETAGTLWLAADEEQLGEVYRKHGYYRARGAPAEILDRAALYKSEPHLRPGLLGALLVPEDVVIYPPAAARFLLMRAQRDGAELFAGEEVCDAGAGRVRLQNGKELRAKTIVNAAGTWAGRMTPGVEIKLRKGHLIITDRCAGFIRHQLVELGYLKSAYSVTADSVAFNVQPRRTGQVLIGSSRQYGAEYPDVDTGVVVRMLRRSQEFLPGIAKLPVIRAWTGFRAATPDKLPVIGPWPEDPSVFLATGHEGLGITTSLGTARFLVDHLLERQSAIPMTPYLPSRAALERAHA